MLQAMWCRSHLHARRHHRNRVAGLFMSKLDRRVRLKPGTTYLTVATVVFLGTLLVAQSPGGVPGNPLPGVTPVEFEEFRLGLDDFLEVETSDEGLGPAYNGTSCGACHSVPAVGGTGHIAEVRAARRGPRGEFIPLDPSGETLFHLF